MATSYKALWQEVCAENERLKETAARQRAAIKNLRLNLRLLNDRLGAAVADARTVTHDAPMILDLPGIAWHLGVKRYTPQQWKQRGILPPVDFPEIKEPLWLGATIKQFAKRTGRPWYEAGAPIDSDDDEGLSPAA